MKRLTISSRSCVLGTIFFSYIVLQIPSAWAIKIAILKHDKAYYAEERIFKECEIRGIECVKIDPFNEAKIVDAIITRAEINSPTDIETMAYIRFLKYYQEKGVPIINMLGPLITAQDKFLSHRAFQKAGLLTPKSYLAYRLSDIYSLIDKEKIFFPMVVKEVYGGRGVGVFKVNDYSELQKLYLRVFLPKTAPMIVQEFLDFAINEKGEVQDMRLWVVRDSYTLKAKCLGGVYRNATKGDFRTNYNFKSYISPAIPSLQGHEACFLASKALEAAGLDFAGVDIALTKDGRYYLIEINATVDTGIDSVRMVDQNLWGHVVELALKKISSGEKVLAHYKKAKMGILKEATTGKKYQLHRGLNVVGRGRLPDISLEDSKFRILSRQHFKIFNIEDEIYLEQFFKTKVPLKLNRKLLSPGERVLLKSGDAIKINSNVLFFHL